MIKFFRQIRRSLLIENKTSKYFKYAMGEIALVVIGILIALSINNWNEQRKLKIIEIETYEILLSSLKKDSTELENILSIQNRSHIIQQQFINTDYLVLKDSLNNKEIYQSLFDLWNGVRSFFPKYGTYNTIISNKGLDILKSKEIKNKLIELYDYKYKKYENIDRIIDEKFHFSFQPFLHRTLGVYFNSSNINEIDPLKLETNYKELVFHCQDLTMVFNGGRSSLIRIQKDVNELISVIEIELREK